MNMANTYANTDYFTKAEGTYRCDLDGREKSLGKGHERTKICAKNLAKLYYQSKLSDKEKIRYLSARHPHLAQGDDANASYIRWFIA